jgi:hypothetical protein
MKKILLIALLFCCSFAFAQISFEKGYFISNEGKRTECFIKNLDWKNTPTEFKYKTQPNDIEFKTQNITTVQEFGIDNESTYKRFKINIDRSSNDVKKMTSNRNPDWHEEVIFLKILVKGDATLYSYTGEDINRYFYETKEIPTEQLIYVKYTQADDNEGAVKINENNEYKQQLFKNVYSSNTTENDILKLSYKKPDLIKYFIKYNNIKPDSAPKTEEKTTKGIFSFKITPGVSIVSLSSKNNVAPELNAQLGNKTIFRIGAEAEYILPYNKNKWSVFINPTYQKYQDEKNYNASSSFTGFPDTQYNIKASYNSIQLPIGIRHYMFLNQKSKIFINAAYSLDLSSKTDISYTNKTANTTINFKGNPGKNLAFGFGYNFKNKFSAEIRLNTKNELVNYVYQSAKYSAIDFIFGYTIF